MKKFLTFALVISMMASLAASASALEYSIAPPKDFDFGRDTSIEVIHTADGGAMRNEDVSKNAALIPPAFGSESMNALHTGEYLTPNLAPGGIPASGAVIGGSASGVITPGSTVNGGSGYQPAVLFTEAMGDLYYKNGSLGRLEIPSLDLSVRIYQGTDSKTLAKGVGRQQGQRDRPQRPCGLRRKYADALHLRPQPAGSAVARHRSGGLNLSPFCRIGSVRLLPLTCDMVKLRRRFPHIHI